MMATIATTIIRNTHTCGLADERREASDKRTRYDVDVICAKAITKCKRFAKV
jgi:hypothetical protein